mmetsp:Transcript_30554/g.66129  ORF Transcript_30554/g.66129 Transcript_30554/m.66129 type:complete len:200 (-) Transcript_30554:2702-3301(-)
MSARATTAGPICPAGTTVVWPVGTTCRTGTPTIPTPTGEIAADTTAAMAIAIAIAATTTTARGNSRGRSRAPTNHCSLRGFPTTRTVVAMSWAVADPPAVCRMRARNGRIRCCPPVAVPTPEIRAGQDPPDVSPTWASLSTAAGRPGRRNLPGLWPVHPPRADRVPTVTTIGTVGGRPETAMSTASVTTAVGAAVAPVV